ncbi:hypothetical protein [Comamonas thiooxydans]|uniref:hypothetical protein n=1 Tax=Comamonas thiooxydans TaxID=363952 RepID=UPI00054E44C5|nr:hypothetical protein [Comamonas thiooxydans]
MPSLELNIEGLRHHSVLVSLFVQVPEVSSEMRKWRSWLVHCMVKTARHYGEARELILAQLEEGRRTAQEMSGGRQLPILDFAFSMEDCITSLEKMLACIEVLTHRGHMVSQQVLALADERKRLNSFRRQQEHMHTQIASGQTGDGPIFVTTSQDGDGIKFRSLNMSFTEIHRLIEAAYHDLAALFPNFDPYSPSSASGTMTLSITATIEVSGQRQGSDLTGA